MQFHFNHICKLLPLVIVRYTFSVQIYKILPTIMMEKFGPAASHEKVKNTLRAWCAQLLGKMSWVLLKFNMLYSNLMVGTFELFLE